MENEAFSWLIPTHRSLREIRAHSRRPIEDEGLLKAETRASLRRSVATCDSGNEDIPRSYAPKEQTIFRSIYFGGGTPSLIPPPLLERVLNVLDKEARQLSPAGAGSFRPPIHKPQIAGGDGVEDTVCQLDAEIQHDSNSSGIGARRLVEELSIEIEPSTIVSEKQLETLVQLGFTRFSVGVQTFDDTILKRLGRANTRAANIRVLRSLQKLVHEYKGRGQRLSISTDVLLSFQGHEQLLEDLRLCTDLGASHISLYGMQIERKSVFGRTLPRDLPTEDEAADLLIEAHQWLLRHGFEHYEVSSFARIDEDIHRARRRTDVFGSVVRGGGGEQGHRCLHNEAYWRLEPFFGFGMGASSLVNLHRWTRPDRLGPYLRWVRGPLAREGFFAATATPPALHKCPPRYQGRHLLRELGVGCFAIGIGNRDIFHQASFQRDSNHSLETRSAAQAGVRTPQAVKTLDTFSASKTAEAPAPLDKGNDSSILPAEDQAPLPSEPCPRGTSCPAERCSGEEAVLQRTHHQLAVEAIVSALRTDDGVDLCALADLDRMLLSRKTEDKCGLSTSDGIDVPESAEGPLLQGVAKGVRNALRAGTAEILVSGQLPVGSALERLLTKWKEDQKSPSGGAETTCGEAVVTNGAGRASCARILRDLDSESGAPASASLAVHEKSSQSSNDGEPVDRLCCEGLSCDAGSVKDSDTVLRVALTSRLVDSECPRSGETTSDLAVGDATENRRLRQPTHELSARLRLRAPRGFLVSNDILSDILCAIDECEKRTRQY
ncbi:radical SAM domain-containing protein [Besnoitia besnoiti]|uniref:Radical SAM domain-containing protein n=1 Tax=Besnoitia besnoiti TaxID=94643 RepID=A0A2A9M2H5_BESBE|nr:radical SAM domain-containing protein [Besnoitia besnoiti]PFH32185.1 radical SAM domain-containing protein [Besnoitia besnoiti]